LQAVALDSKYKEVPYVTVDTEALGNRGCRSTDPTEIIWCDGSHAESQKINALLVENGTFEKLNQKIRPNSFISRTDPADVARVESRTFICSEDEKDAGPTNNWVEPAKMRAELNEKFAGSMRGRKMYVIPFSMGPLNSPLARYGVEITDSPYVVASMRIMTRVSGKIVDRLPRGLTGSQLFIRLASH